MSDDLQARRRRAAYRATHRGTKEMDIALGSFAEAVLAGMPAERLAAFERFIALPDPELQAMIYDPGRCRLGEFAGFIAELRAFHGLVGDADGAGQA
jgi:antitoxin CptB